MIILVLMINQKSAAQILQDSGTNNSLYDILFIDEFNGWVVGGGGTILKTTDGGGNWEQLTYSADTENAYLLSVFFINHETGWIAGAKGADFNFSDAILMKTTNGGNTWDEIPYTGNWLSHIQFINDTTGWIIDHTGNNKIRKTTDGGVNWETQIEETQQYEYFSVLHFLDDSIGWALGHHNVYKTTNSGRNWLRITDPFEMQVLKLSFINANFGWISTGAFLHKTEDGGNSWTTYETKLKYGNDFEIRDLLFLNKNFGVVTTSGGIYTTHDGGENFELFYSSQSGQYVFGTTYYVNNQNCWGIGRRGKILKFSVDPTATGINRREEFNITPDQFMLFQNYPNPFNPSTNIRFSLQKSDYIALKIFNIAGQKVASLVDEVLAAGEHQVHWQADGLPAGIYLARLQSGSATKIMKLILQK